MMNRLKETYDSILKATVYKLAKDHTLQVVVDAQIHKKTKEGTDITIDDLLAHFDLAEKKSEKEETEADMQKRVSAEATYTIAKGLQPATNTTPVKWTYKTEPISRDKGEKIMDMISQMRRFNPGYILPEPETNLRNTSYNGPMTIKLKSNKNH